MREPDRENADAVRIDWLDPADADKTLIQQIVQLHRDTLPDDLTSAFKRAYQESLFSRLILENTCIIASADERILAFCIVANPTTVRKALLSKPVSLAFNLMRLTLAHPERFIEFVYTAVSSTLRPGHLPDRPEIFTICVDDAKHSMGLGGNMIRMVTQKYGELGLLTRSSNANAIRFYLRMGFSPIGRERRFRRKFTILLFKSSGQEARGKP